MSRRLALLNEVEPAEVTWLWPDRIPCGGLTILEGDPGTNKTTITNGLVAHVTGGKVLYGASECNDRGGAIVLQGEDPVERTRKNLEGAGADLRKILVLDKKAISSGKWLTLPDDATFLEAEAKRSRAKLIVIDPVSAFFGPHLSGEQGIRRAVAPLASLAEELGAAVVLVRHLTKSGKGSALYRGLGSVALSAAARSMLLVAVNPADAEERVLAQTKSSFGPKAESLVFRPHDDDGALLVEWLGASNYSAEQLHEVTTSGGQSALEEAIVVLFSILGEGPLLAGIVLKLVRNAGVAERTCRRAKSVLGVKSQRDGFGRGSKFFWVMPEEETVVKRLRAKEMDNLAQQLFGEGAASEVKGSEELTVAASGKTGARKP